MAKRHITARIDDAIVSAIDREVARRRQEELEWTRNRVLENALYDFYFGKRRRRLM